MKRTIDEMFQTPCWIIDILPEQVPENSPGQFFAVEKYYLKKKRLTEIKQKHINVILKLNCYRDISLDEDTALNPPPEKVAEEMLSRYLCILVDDSMLVSEPDETHMTVFDPDEKLIELIKTLASGEGLFVWKSKNDN